MAGGDGMNEYIDQKHRRHKITESIRKTEDSEKMTEKDKAYRRESAEREIAEALYRIFMRKNAEETR